MVKLQAALEALLRTVGIVTKGTIPRLSRLPPNFEPIHTIYKRLGGVLDSPTIRLGSWDIEFNGVVLEFDEYLHFNGYRALTLHSKCYERLPQFPLTEYKHFCAVHASDCLRAGGYAGKWTNRSCERQFGRASPCGDLTGNGASRWKQRALYDFAKDMLPLLHNVRVARIAIWDVIVDGPGPRTVLDVLREPTQHSASALANLAMSRVTGPPE